VWKWRTECIVEPYVLNVHCSIHLSSKSCDMSLIYGIIKTWISFGWGYVTSLDCIKQSKSVSMNSSIHAAIANISSWNRLQCWAYTRDIAVAWLSYGLLINLGAICSQHIYCLNMAFQSITLLSLGGLAQFFTFRPLTPVFHSQAALSHLLTVGVECYCCTWSHTRWHMHTHARTHTHTHTHTNPQNYTRFNSAGREILNFVLPSWV
jgi:hypothetical protein